MNDQADPQPDHREREDAERDEEKTLAADSDDVSEFVEKLVEEPGAPMNEEGIINNP